MTDLRYANQIKNSDILFVSLFEMKSFERSSYVMAEYGRGAKMPNCQFSMETHFSRFETFIISYACTDESHTTAFVLLLIDSHRIESVI